MKFARAHSSYGAARASLMARWILSCISRKKNFYSVPMKTSLKRPASCRASQRQGCHLLSYPARSGHMARKPPWKKANPRKAKGKKSKKLSPAKKAAAKRTAKKAGRKYPSLVDNMRAASSKKTRAKTKSRKKPAKSKR
jgi:hypothetical protein